MSDDREYFVKAPGKNIEKMTGITKVPMGVAGPINGLMLPLATTEGALVASVNRGCKAVSLSGGARVRVENVGATRGPAFLVKDLNEGEKLIKWVEKNQDKMAKVARVREKHLKLLGVKTAMVGRRVYLRMSFDTGEAMGMNMVTMATEAIAEVIAKELRIKCVAISGNYCVDKKASWLNMTEGRGKKVWAEVELPEKIVKDALKTSCEKIVEVVKTKQWLGSMLSGSMGFNAHYANMVAAIYLATGQDLAHVVEGSMGITTAEIVKGGLYFSVYLPAVMVGTVGGGTMLPTQREALKLMGLDGVKKGDSVKLAEAVGLAVLAGELSLTAALASGDLGRAHQKLGRGK